MFTTVNTYYRTRNVCLILTEECLHNRGLLFTCQAALQYSCRIILVHDQESCTFPSVQEQPDFLQKASVFHDKAVTFMADFVHACCEQILKKIEKKSTNQLV